MVSPTLFLIGMLGILICLAACRGEPSPSAGRTAAAVTVLPTPTESPPTRPPAAATATATAPTPVPTASAPARPTETKPQTPPTDEPFMSTSSQTEPGPGSNGSPDDVTATRQIVKEYWDALNDYDVDRALPMLEPGYRVQEEGPIRQDIDRMRMFRVKLGVSEESPPAQNKNGDYETYLKLETPIDTRRVLMIFRRIDGQWQITYSDEVE